MLKLRITAGGADRAEQAVSSGDTPVAPDVASACRRTRAASRSVLRRGNILSDLDEGIRKLQVFMTVPPEMLTVP